MVRAKALRSTIATVAKASVYAHAQDTQTQWGNRLQKQILVSHRITPMLMIGPA